MTYEMYMYIYIYTYMWIYHIVYDIVTATKDTGADEQTSAHDQQL